MVLLNGDDAAIDRTTIDTAMMRRCIRLSATAAERGEFPFASIICSGETVIAEATNQVAQEGDVTRHAEMLAMSEAQKKIGRKDLSKFTLYSNVEPCAMCSFPIRETRIGRVVYAIGSPMMGGLSKWNILRDTELSEAMPEVFGPVPEVIAGLCQREAEKVWWSWNPLAWAVIRQRGCLGRAADPVNGDRLPAIPHRVGFIGRLMLLYSIYRRG
jgi:tRNA(adenine34) deaminase